jgi:hypothetical protein
MLAQHLREDPRPDRKTREPNVPFDGLQDPLPPDDRIARGPGPGGATWRHDGSGRLSVEENLLPLLQPEQILRAIREYGYAFGVDAVGEDHRHRLHGSDLPEQMEQLPGRRLEIRSDRTRPNVYRPFPLESSMDREKRKGGKW